MRRRRSARSASGTLTRKGRIASAWDGAPVRVGCCANTVAGGARDTIAAQSTTKSRPKAPAVAEVARMLRRAGANDTADMIILLRGRTILAVGECFILGLVPVH